MMPVLIELVKELFGPRGVVRSEEGIRFRFRAEERGNGRE